MRALSITENGGPEVLGVREVPTPSPGPGQVLVQVQVSGVNFIDVYHRSGAYGVPLPFTLGSEGAGEVAEVGDGVAGLRVGDRVAWAMHPGAHAEYAALPSDQLVRIPGGVSDADAAAVLLQGMTAHYLTHSTYPVQPGDWTLVHAAAGGAGLLVTQLVKKRGGKVIGTVSTPEKAELARRAGADEVLDYTEVADLAAEVRALTAGVGVAVAYDGVGKTTFEASLASLRVRGMLALYGAASGPAPAFDPQRLNAGGSLFLTRPTLAHYAADKGERDWRAGELFGWLADGSLSLHIGGAYALEDAREAYEALESRRTTGKLLLTR